MKKNLLSIAGILLLAACTQTVSKAAIDRDGQYWQRINAASATYTYGKKGQQLLNHHIAFCVAELETLQSLGDVTRPLHRTPNGAFQSVKEAEYYGWKRNDPDGVDLDNHGEYHNFEGCMLAHGWERVKYVPYDTAIRARDAHKAAHYSSAHDDEAKKKKRSGASHKDVDERSDYND